MQTTSVTPIQMSVLSNGVKSKNSIIEKYIGFILSLLSAAIIFLCGFVIKVEGMMVRWEERDMEKTNSINRLEQKVNTIQLDVADLKITTTRIDTKQNIKTHNNE